MKLLFLDTETTGTNEKLHGVVQISGIIEIDGDVKEEFDHDCRLFPGQIYDFKALEVTGKTIREIESYPSPGETYKKILQSFEKYINRYDRNDKFYLVGQNVKFDYDFMDAWFKLNGNQYFYAYIAYHVLDIMALSNFFNVAGIIKTKNMKLKTIADFFGITFGAHDSAEDIRATRDIYYKYLSILRTARVPEEIKNLMKGGENSDGINA